MSDEYTVSDLLAEVDAARDALADTQRPDAVAKRRAQDALTAR